MFDCRFEVFVAVIMYMYVDYDLQTFNTFEQS